MYKDTSDKCYPDSKGRLQKKKTCEKYQNLSEEQKGKKQQYWLIDIKILLKMKNKS